MCRLTTCNMADWGGLVQWPLSQMLTMKSSNFDVSYQSIGYYADFQLFDDQK